MRILVIDDEENIRMMVRMALEHQKHKVETAADAYEGMLKFGDGLKWDIVLLDQRMPGVQGLETLLEMKRRDPSARVIMISAYGIYSLAQEAMMDGAIDFIRKPFTIDTLNNTIKIAMSREIRPYEQLQPSISDPVFQTPAIDGYRIESRINKGRRTGNTTLFDFVVRAPSDDAYSCTVILPDYIIALVKTHINVEHVPYGERFWQSFCEEAIIQYLWQHTGTPVSFPNDGNIKIEELTDDLLRWVKNTLVSLNEYMSDKK